MLSLRYKDSHNLFSCFFLKQLYLHHLHIGQNRQSQTKLTLFLSSKAQQRCIRTLFSVSRKPGCPTYDMAITLIQPFWDRKAQFHDPASLQKGQRKQPLCKGVRERSKIYSMSGI